MRGQDSRLKMVRRQRPSSNEELLMKTVYLASPLGFSPEWKTYRDRIKQRLHDLGCTVLDPWEGPFGPAIAEASAMQDWPSRVAAFKDIAMKIGKANEEMIRSCVREVLKIAHRVYVLRNGVVSYSGVAETLSDDAKLVEVYLGPGGGPKRNKFWGQSTLR